MMEEDEDSSVANHDIIQKVKVIEGVRFLQSTRIHLAGVKEEEEGAGPSTYWRPLYGPRVILTTEPIVIDDDDDSVIEEDKGGLRIFLKL